MQLQRHTGTDRADSHPALGTLTLLNDRDILCSRDKSLSILEHRKGRTDTSMSSKANYPVPTSENGVVTHTRILVKRCCGRARRTQYLVNSLVTTIRC